MLGKLLVLSQVILSLQLPFAVISPFTSSRRKMGRFVNNWIIFLIAAAVALIICVLNVYLLVSSIRDNGFGTAGDV